MRCSRQSPRQRHRTCMDGKRTHFTKNLLTGPEADRPANREALINLLMTGSAMNAADATKTVDEWIKSYDRTMQELRAAADAAAKKAGGIADRAAVATGAAAIWTFVAFWTGAAAAVWGGWCGAAGFSRERVPDSARTAPGQQVQGRRVELSSLAGIFHACCAWRREAHLSVLAGKPLLIWRLNNSPSAKVGLSSTAVNDNLHAPCPRNRHAATRSSFGLPRMGEPLSSGGNGRRKAAADSSSDSCWPEVSLDFCSPPLQ